MMTKRARRRRGKRNAVVMALSAAGTLASWSAHTTDADLYSRPYALDAPRLSPDGAWITFLRQENEQQWVMAQRSNGTDLRSLFGVRLPGQRIRHCLWAGPVQLVCGIGVIVRRRDLVIEEAQLHLFDLGAGSHRQLMQSSRDPIADRVVDAYPEEGTALLIQHDEDRDGFPEVSRLDLASGALRRVVRAHPPIRHWMTDGRGQVRLGLGFEEGVGRVFVQGAKPNEWSLLAESDRMETGAFGPIGFGAAPADLFALRVHDGRYALFHIDLDREGAASLMASHPLYDILGPLDLNPATHDLLAVRYLATHVESHFFDSGAAARQGWMDEQLPGRVNYVFERSRDDSRQLVWSEADVDPPSVFVLDAKVGTLLPVGHLYPQLESRHLAPTRPVVYRARDGQAIPAYLTLPTSRPPVGLPSVILPHGGPETRDHWRFDPLVQFLAAEGYAVLQMNFRGSVGFGVAFAAAGAGHWGSTVHHDITDGARWLAEEGYADARRICIIGSSFGGYAALLGAARESSVYRCAASFAGVSDLVALAEFKDRFQFAEIWRSRIGSDRTVLAQMSPLALVDLIEIPVLLIHAPDDAVVPVQQSRRLAAALRRADKRYEFLEVPACDHDMTAEACRRVVFEAFGAFLKRWLHTAEPH